MMKTPLCTGFTDPHRLTRRSFLNQFGMGLGAVALADLLAREGDASVAPPLDRGVLGAPHARASAKRVIYMFMSGGPSQMDLLDPKPLLNQRHGEELPASVRMGQRLTAMSGEPGEPALGRVALQIPPVWSEWKRV